MLDRFTSHPASVGETYAEHLVAASGFGLRMIIAGLACMLHGLLPFLFVKTGSRCVDALHKQMVTKRIKPASDDAATSGQTTDYCASLPASRPAIAPNTTALASPIAGI